MINVKEELLDTLYQINKTVDDILFINIKLYNKWSDYDNEKIKSETVSTKKEILNLLDRYDISYDDGFGSQNLFGVIVFKDNTWLERYEYDGSEGWDYKKCPKIEDYKELEL